MNTLDSSPSILPLYLKAALPLVPGASSLPFVPGGGDEIPAGLGFELTGVIPKQGQVAEYAKVCGFGLKDSLPPTIPHVLAFPLQMAVMSDGSFPFGAVGLVHVENSITQLRPVSFVEPLDIRGEHAGTLRVVVPQQPQLFLPTDVREVPHHERARGDDGAMRVIAEGQPDEDDECDRERDREDVCDHEQQMRRQSHVQSR